MSNHKNKIKEYFSKKTDKEIFAILLFFSCIILMTVLSAFRFCGIGYFANEYREHNFVPWVQEAILFALKWFELIFVLATITRLKPIWFISISFCYTNLYWFAETNTVSILLDSIYFIFLPFFCSKFEYKRIGYGILLIILVLAYQMLTMIGRYSIDLTLKFNYVAGIASVFDYKTFIVSIYLLVYNWRLKMKRINTPNPNDEKNFGGGHCTFLFGKFEKICEIIGEIVVGIGTIGIAPLSVYLYRKQKAKKKTKEDEKTE